MVPYMLASDPQHNYLKNRRRQLTQHRQRVVDAERWYEQRIDALVAQDAPIEMIGHLRLLAKDAKFLGGQLERAIKLVNAELQAISESVTQQSQLLGRHSILLDQVSQHQTMIHLYIRQAKAYQFHDAEADVVPRLWWAVERLSNICKQLQLAIKAIEAEIEV